MAARQLTEGQRKELRELLLLREVDPEAMTFKSIARKVRCSERTVAREAAWLRAEKEAS